VTVTLNERRRSKVCINVIGTALEPLLTSAQAAASLSAAPETVRKLCHCGKLTYAKIGSEYRFRRSDLNALFVQSQNGTPVRLSREEALRLLK
jgi:excisionase family DNA binding protein